MSYTKPTISNYNDNPPTNDGSENFTDNGVDWDRHIDEIGDPIKDYLDSVNNATDAEFTEINNNKATNVKDDPYNATGGDGTTDDTTAIQLAIDSNKGGTILLPGDNTFLHAGILLDGSSYDNTTIICEGVMKLAPDAGSTNFGSSWVGIILKDCDNVTLTYRGDGNRANMSDIEAIHLVGIAGASNINMPLFTFKEIQGDGLYISQSDWTSSTTIPTNIVIGSFSGFNSADDGRNALSVISVDGLHIGNFVSKNIGGTVNSTVMPGGLDIEPNFGYQYCSNITVNGGYVLTAGTEGFSIIGKAVTNDATRDWNCSNIKVNLTVEKSGALSASICRRFKTSTLNLKYLSESSVRAQGYQIDYADDINGSLTLDHVTDGVFLGYNDSLVNFDLQIFVTDYSGTGLLTTELTNGKIRGRINGASVGTAYSIRTHANSRGAITQTNIRYQVDVPEDGTVSVGFRNEPGQLITYSGCRISNCDISGYATLDEAIQAQISRNNVEGISYQTSIPTEGEWVIGDVVENTNPSRDGDDMVISGWIRMTTSANNVSGTDWAIMHVSHVTPAA